MTSETEEKRRIAMHETQAHVAKITATIDRMSVYPHVNPITIGFLSFLERVGMWLVRRATRKYEAARNE